MPSEFASYCGILLLISLRIVPSMAFAPPFTLVRAPPIVRVCLAIGIAAAIYDGARAIRLPQLPSGTGGWFYAGLAELLIGTLIAFTLHWVFAMIAMMGRALDIQAGFGLALLVDPTLRTQTPLIGTLLAYAAASIFFLTNGPSDLLFALSESYRIVPLGGAVTVANTGGVLTFVSLACGMALLSVGMLLAVLLIVDIAVAFLSRTLPQMNVLLLGFQVKALVTLMLLPLLMATAAGVLARLVRTATEASARILAF